MDVVSRICVMFAIFGISACSNHHPPLKTVDKVDLNRFMGDWFVIASIPTFIEKDAYNAVESYKMDVKGRIETKFTFRDGGFDGKKKQYNPTGFVFDTESNAIWGMQFLWPIKADYRIVYLDQDYSITVIARQKRDYVWIMARTPQIPEADYKKMTDLLTQIGYDTDRLRKVPQKWTESELETRTSSER